MFDKTFNKLNKHDSVTPYIQYSYKENYQSAVPSISSYYAKHPSYIKQKENLNISQNDQKRPITVGKIRKDRGSSVSNKCIINHLISPRVAGKHEFLDRNPTEDYIKDMHVLKACTQNTTMNIKDALKLINGQANVLKDNTNHSRPPVSHAFVKKVFAPLAQTKSPSTRSIKPVNVGALNTSLSAESKSNLDDYSMGKQIGQGAYAIVKEANQKSTGKKIAMKIYDKYRLLDPQRKKSVINEIRILKKLDHRNIVKIYDSVDTSKQLCLIMEYANGSSLHSYTKTKAMRKVPEIEAKKIFKQVVSAIDYCHQRGICHRDIKMDNIIVDKSIGVKLIDFGFSTYSGKDQMLRIYCGTPSYMSPEIVTKTPYNGLKADLWALGILLYVLLQGAYPFKASSDRDLYKKIAKGSYPAPDGISQSAVNLISKLLVVDPNKRISADKILQDGFFSFEEDEKITRAGAKYGKTIVERLV